VVADADQIHSPGAVLLEGERLVAAGPPERIGPANEGTELITRPRSLVTPPLVNAHAHLDLSDLSAPDERTPFTEWLGRVRAHRLEQRAEGAVERAVALGVDQSWAGGCPYVGDICGSRRAFTSALGSLHGGICYLEVMGHEERVAPGIAEIEWVLAGDRPDAPGPAAGLSPHAPYSAATQLYEAAARSGLPVATHLAESLEELEWCRTGSGLFADMLTRFGYRPGEVHHPVSHPVDAFLGLLPGDRGTAVHLNYLDHAHVELVRRSGVTVVYCPRASRYLGHPDPGHRPHAWRELLAAGVPVALGTDGRPCLPGPGIRSKRLSVLDDAVQLVAEGATLEEWLPMATVHGARALGLERDLVTLAPGVKAGLVAIDIADGSNDRPEPEGGIEWLIRTPSS